MNEIVSLDIVPYDAVLKNDPNALLALKRALHENGIVGIRGIPGYLDKSSRFIETARQFSALSEDVKESYAPDREAGDLFLGYEKGKEKFQKPDGQWAVDDLKTSYYGYIPDGSYNKWPREIDLKGPFQEIGLLMSETGVLVMNKIGLLGDGVSFNLDGVLRLGRMLYYQKSTESNLDNPLWCGAHFDHSLFTALMPAHYFVNGEQVKEPEEAGLFVKTTRDGVFKKVVCHDPDVMLFQVGEFGQLVSNDGIRATKHQVNKAKGCVERFAMALFFDAPMEATIRSTSELTKDARYAGSAGELCSYRHWHDETFKQNLVQ